MSVKRKSGVTLDTGQVSEAQMAYLKQQSQHRKFVKAMRISIVIAFFFLWELAVRVGWIDGFIFSSPVRIWETMMSMGKDGSLWMHTGATLFETMISFFLTVLLGILTAVLLWCSDSAAEITEPFFVVLNSLPKSALAPLLIVWLGANQKTIIVAGMSVAIFGTILNLYTGFKESGSEKTRLIYTLGGKKHHVLTKVILPSNIPSIISIMKVDIGLCLVGVIIGEFMGARRGLGYLIIYSSQVFQLTRLIMAILILCVIAMVLYGILSMVEKRVRK